MLRPLAAFVAVALLLSGCASSPGAEGPGDATGTDTPCDPAVDVNACEPQPLSADSSVPAPTWAVGQWWEWQPEDGNGVGTPFRAVVVSTSADGAVLGSDVALRAKQDAAFDQLMLGEVGAGLALSGWNLDWDMLSFPLTNGKTWTATIANIAWDEHPYDQPLDLDMRAEFDEALQGFRIMGHAGEDMLFEATYLPATGFYGEFVVYDTDEGQPPLEFSYTALSAGHNFTGPVYTATAEPLLNLIDAIGFDDVPIEGGQPVVAPQPHGTFTMANGDLLFGQVGALAIVGSRVVTLTDPANEQRQVVATGAPEDEQVLLVDEAGVAGQWTVATSGAGGLSVGWASLYAVTLTETLL